MNSITNIYICNNLKLIIDYVVNPTRIGDSISNGILLGYKTIKIRLAKEDRSKKLTLNLQKVFYLSNSISNLVSLRFFNNTNIYHNNKN